MHFCKKIGSVREILQSTVSFDHPVSLSIICKRPNWNVGQVVQEAETSFEHNMQAPHHLPQNAMHPQSQGHNYKADHFQSGSEKDILNRATIEIWKITNLFVETNCHSHQMLGNIYAGERCMLGFLGNIYSNVILHLQRGFGVVLWDPCTLPSTFADI